MSLRQSEAASARAMQEMWAMLTDARDDFRPSSEAGESLDTAAAGARVWFHRA